MGEGMGGKGKRGEEEGIGRVGGRVVTRAGKED